MSSLNTEIPITSKTFLKTTKYNIVQQQLIQQCCKLKIEKSLTLHDGQDIYYYNQYNGDVDIL